MAVCLWAGCGQAWSKSLIVTPEEAAKLRQTCLDAANAVIGAHNAYATHKSTSPEATDNLRLRIQRNDEWRDTGSKLLSTRTRMHRIWVKVCWRKGFCERTAGAAENVRVANYEKCVKQMSMEK